MKFHRQPDKNFCSVKNFQIGLFQDLDGVKDPVWRELGKLQAAAQTVCHDIFRVERLYFLHQPASQVNRCVVKFFFKPHNTGHTTAKKVSFDGLQVNTGDYFQQIEIRSPDVLLS